MAWLTGTKRTERMKITTTDKLPELNVEGLNKILQIRPDVSNETKERLHEARREEHVTHLHEG